MYPDPFDENHRMFERELDVMCDTVGPGPGFRNLAKKAEEGPK